jgi:1,4-dihydroxy-2-naphthoyl-CoA hydrolase
MDVPLSPFDQHIGTEFLEFGPERATARLVVADHHKQPVGFVHGGVFCTVAESLASRATARVVRPDGMQALGLSNNATFLRPVSAGTIHVEATRRHGGRTTWIWDVECKNDEGRVCALNRVTIAVRPLREGQ